jgi:hypothetical protein
MPLEIRELHIKVNVGGGPGDAQGGSSAPPPKSGKEEGEDREAVIARAVEEAMRVMRDRKER